MTVELLAEGAKLVINEVSKRQLSETAARAVAETGVREGKHLHEVMGYSVSDLKQYVGETCENSVAHRRSIESGELTRQAKGEIAERLVEDRFGQYGEIQKLSVGKESGTHTADFLVTLDKPLVHGSREFKPGTKLVVEVKYGTPDYCIGELRNPTSHARVQMAETAKREGADGAICLLPREVQERRAQIEQIKASIKANEGDGTYIWMGLPHEGAMAAAASAFRV